MDNHSKEYLEQYMKLTPAILTKITTHCRRYGIKEEVCAWYANMEDFFEDWCDGCGYSRTEARRIYHGGIGEFQTFPSGNIIRYTL